MSPLMPIPIVGYVNRFSAKPGGQIEVKVSCTLNEPYEARLVRIRGADPNPIGPGQKIIDLSTVFRQILPSRVQKVALGSYGRIAHSAHLSVGKSAVTWGALVRPSLLGSGPMTVLSKGDPATAGVRLSIADAGVIAEVATVGSEMLRAVTTQPLRRDVWYRVWLAINPATRTLLVGCASSLAGMGAAGLISVVAPMRVPEGTNPFALKNSGQGCIAPLLGMLGLLAMTALLSPLAIALFVWRNHPATCAVIGLIAVPYGYLLWSVATKMAASRLVQREPELIELVDPRK